ncbi:MAG: multifunctional transcriptional regulator/nicotinamide-nucleotide adenylyltransferase/ribosylnicotinamide kinase NadR [Tetragenococcus koreensis]|nr:multifunctional transcriptional regulator/nicotinamide-nucleotide adenylyltransferase/ribosylnicotinamide kinase NadR [Tetragenococcus koreensis]
MVTKNYLTVNEFKNKKENLGTTYGVVVGKFYPLHKGHVDLIQKASSFVDHLFVVVSHSDKRDDKLFMDSKMKRPLTPKTKLKIVQKTFQMQRDIITPVLVDESNIPEYPNGWPEWSDLVKKAIFDHRSSNFNLEGLKTENTFFFSSEPQDAQGYLDNFGFSTVIVDEARENVDISATRVRNDPASYWDYLPRASREELAPTIVIAGGESSGKTLMTDKLGNYFGTTTVWEYGRDYCNLELGGDEGALQYSDYQNIANGHYQDVRYARRNANRLVISDTDYVATQAFCLTYEGSSHPSVQDKIENDPFDLVILLDNSTKWVDDGMRLIGDSDKRQAFQQLLKVLYEKNNIPYVEVKASSYYDRYELCKKIIKKYIEEDTSVDSLQLYVDSVVGGKE